MLFKCLWQSKCYVCAWLIPIVLLPIPFLIKSSEGKCAYVVLLMSLYWFTEAIPISVTALLPIVLFPLLGILSSDLTSKAYINGTLMIFLGSLIAAVAVEKSNLHKRIALKVLLITGTSPKRLLFGFMFTTAFLSMWISNLASSALIIPIINAALDQLKQRKLTKSYETLVTIQKNKLAIDSKEEHHKSLVLRKNSNTHIKITEEYENEKNLRKAVFLGVCYSANIGGTGTLTGTSTNLILNGVLKEDPVSFSEWMIFNIPGMFILIFVTWVIIICLYLRKANNSFDTEKDEVVYKAIKNEYDQLGSITFYEFAVFILFILMLSLWFFRDPDFLKGWAPFINSHHNFIDDSCPALLVAILFFVIPAKPSEPNTSPPLLDWKTTQESVAWGIIILLGGGFAMAEGAEASGLSVWLGSQLSVLERFSPFVITIIVCLIALMLTEVLSNAGTCTIVLPVIKRMAIELKLNPLSVMLPVTLSCSYAFMLPVASGPNAIIFESAGINTKHMVCIGLISKLLIPPVS